MKHLLLWTRRAGDAVRGGAARRAARRNDPAHAARCTETRLVRRLVGDRAWSPLQGRTLRCSDPAGTCRGVHFDPVQQVSWSSSDQPTSS